MDVKEKILDAIQLLASNSVKKAGYDKTIQAQVVSCEDATIGKYRCRYQDSTFYAYASTSDTSFSNGSYVYILVPENDFKKEKTILGTTAKLGINYISQAEGDEAYEITGTNCITFTGAYYLNTNNKNYKYVLYDHSTGFIANGLNLDETALNQYIKESSSLIVGATFKTSIPSERQARGHYGIVYDLVFLDNATNQETHRSYIVDEDNMTDNPYRLLYPTRQYEIFDIDGTNFVRVDSIAIFNADFPNADGNVTDGLLTSGDIEITNLEISGAVRLSDEQLNGVTIKWNTSQGGTFFRQGTPSTEEKKIVAQVIIKGKVASSAQHIPFYWGRENVTISPSSKTYNKQLGRGWECLNDFNSITTDDNGNLVVEWIPDDDTLFVSKAKAIAYENKYKVAIVYENTIISKEITIINEEITAPKIIIESDKNDDKFYYDLGHPTLTCAVEIDGVRQTASNYEYYWVYESDKGVVTELPETDDLNTQYRQLYDELNGLRRGQRQSGNTTERVYPEASKERIEELQSTLKEYDFIQRVQGNVIHDVQIRNITNRGIFKCSVYLKSQDQEGNPSLIYQGTAAKVLTNSFAGENVYSLVINNGSQTFQYNEAGIAPNNGSLDNPQELQSLSFTLYDNLGETIDFDILSRSPNCEINWYFPIKNTLLENTRINENGSQQELNDATNSGIDPTSNYKIYKKNERIVFGINKNYDISKRNNQIKLNVKYKEMNLTAETDFAFIKQGEPGTNGTEYIVKLVPNTQMDDPPRYPMITRVEDGNRSGYYLNYGLGTHDSETSISYGSGDSRQFLKAQLWYNGDLVWDGFSINDPAHDGLTRPTAVHWEVLRNKYSRNLQDESAFEFSNEATGHFYYTGDHLANNESYITPFANIIKCSITWEDKTYYGTIPITTAWVNNANYRIELKDNTGFRHVMYTSDGMTPQYDTTYPFEFVFKEKIPHDNSDGTDNGGFWEDISLIEDRNLTYTFESCGNYKTVVNEDSVTGTGKNIILLEPLNQPYYVGQLPKNQRRYRPNSRYDGQCVNIAALCQVTQNSTVVGRINIPVHFLLNKYGLAHINDWDGNSVQINEEGGYILSPQMGAGTKDNNNRFTGVLMGSVQVAGKDDPDTGLLGYSEGDRTFFVNSQNGSAIFGRAGNGQIIIDPSTGSDTVDGVVVPRNRALLYSSAFWKEYDKVTGLPKNYSNNNINSLLGEHRIDINPQTNPTGSRGMLIDLTTPQIAFANGNFFVNQEGHLTARGGGNIAGWQIKDKYLQSENNSLTLRSTTEAVTVDGETVSIPPAIYSENHKTLRNTGAGFFLSDTGLSIGSKFYADSTGIVKIGLGAVSDDPNASKKHWTINTTGSGTTDDSYISYNTSVFANNVVNPTNPNEYGQAFANNSSVYLGTNGLSLGRHFSVDNYGKVSIIYGSIDMRTHANTTRIKTDANGNWMQDSNGNLITETVSAGKQLFYVDTATSSLVIHVNNGTINLGNKFTVDNQGNMRATSGKIGGFFIGNKYLTNPSTLDEFIEVDTTDIAQKNKQKVYSVYLGTDGISLGKNFSVNNQGIMKIRRGSIQLGYRTSDQSWNFSVDDDGKLSAKSGDIGGIIIQSDQIKGATYYNNVMQGGFTLNKNGTIQIGPPGNRTYILGGRSTNYNQSGDIIGYNEGSTKIRIQPGNGTAKFNLLDVGNNGISFAQHLRGYASVTFGSSGDTVVSNLTFDVDSTNGFLGTRGAIKGYNGAMWDGSQTFWISAVTGAAEFTGAVQVGGNLIIDPSGAHTIYIGGQDLTSYIQNAAGSTGTGTYTYTNSSGETIVYNFQNNYDDSSVWNAINELRYNDEHGFDEWIYPAYVEACTANEGSLRNRVKALEDAPAGITEARVNELIAAALENYKPTAVFG